MTLSVMAPRQPAQHNSIIIISMYLLSLNPQTTLKCACIEPITQTIVQVHLFELDHDIYSKDGFTEEVTSYAVGVVSVCT